MTKKWVLAVALLSLAISMGCRNVTGVSKVKVVISDPGNLSILFVTQVVQFTATVTGTSNTAVTWSLSGAACTGTPNPCGTLDSSGKYTAPPTAPNPGDLTITATSQADSSASDSFPVTVKQISVVITPSPVNVGVNLKQQFVAVALPDEAPQTVDWTIAACPSQACGKVDANGLYTAPPSVTSDNFTVQATSQLDPANGVGNAKVTVVGSRLPSGSYAFRLSGFNSSGATAVVGNFVSNGDGTIQGGVEDDLTSGGHVPRVINASTYSLISNSQGTITLAPSGVSAREYTMVLDASGDIQMIDSTSDGTNPHGSGVIEPVTLSKFKDKASLNGTFVFEFAGVDLSGKRVAYAGLLPMDGNGGIAGGLLDTNDNGGGTNGTPLSVAGTYTMSNGVGTMSLTAGGQTYTFALYGVSGPAKSALTLYAISTAFDATQPAISGTMVLQDSTQTYSNGALKGATVVNLTGVVDSNDTNTNVSLTLATTDGVGNISGTFDQNNGGTITGPAQAFGTGYKYSVAGCNNCGRYTVNLLGNPTSNPPAPMQFIMYASGANRGFLLDQSSTSVITGTMVPQTAPKAQFGIFAASNIPGTYAAATTSSATSGVDAIAANLQLTWVNPTQGVSGFQYDAGHAPPGETVTGAYTLDGSGAGTFTLTVPSAEKYVIYLIDITHLLAMDVDSGNANASIIYAQQ
jgi:hypothetical protein